MVPADSAISWAIPFDNFVFLANGTNKTVTGSLASFDIYRSYTFLSFLLLSFASILRS